MKRIALKINVQKDKDLACAKEVLAVLRSFCEKIYVEDTYKSLASEKVFFYGGDTIPKDSELIMVLGGDGTMLHAACDAVKYDLPMLGINMGRVGYLASLEIGEIDTLARLDSDDFLEKQHMLFSVTVKKKNGEEIFLGYALNDVVIDGKGHLADIRLNDGKNTLDYRANALIAATPTGSTAYSFSAGGPVMDEAMEAICITPVCPRSFFSRSLLFAPSSVLSIENRRTRDGDLEISIDGYTHTPLSYGDSVCVCRAQKRIRILALKERRLLEVLCTKMDTRYF